MATDNKILSVRWVSARETIGFVLTVNGIGQISLRTGKAANVNPQYDSRQIADWGGKLTKEVALAMFPELAEQIADNWKED